VSHIDHEKYTLLPNSRADAVWLLRRAWQVGDTMRICELLGVEYIPPMPSPDMDLDDEWRFMVEHARRWIEDIYRRLYEQEPSAREREGPCKWRG
jgi:hypothetical protein